MGMQRSAPEKTRMILEIDFSFLSGKNSHLPWTSKMAILIIQNSKPFQCFHVYVCVFNEDLCSVK